MRTIYFLTEHAEQRLRERSSLSPEEATRLINLDPPVFVGFPQEDNRIGHCIYSKPDERFLVAIGNVMDGAIATVLTLAQFQLTHGHVTDDKLWRARRHVLPDEGPEEGAPRGLSLNVEMVRRRDRRVVVRHLGHVPGYSLDAGVEALADDRIFMRKVRELCMERNWDARRVTALFAYERPDDVGVGIPCGLLRAPPPSRTDPWTADAARRQARALLGGVDAWLAANTEADD